MALLKALCRALIFIIRIRFPPGMSLATLSPSDKCSEIYNVANTYL